MPWCWPLSSSELTEASFHKSYYLQHLLFLLVVQDWKYFQILLVSALFHFYFYNHAYSDCSFSSGEKKKIDFEELIARILDTYHNANFDKKMHPWDIGFEEQKLFSSS